VKCGATQDDTCGNPCQIAAMSDLIIKVCGLSTAETMAAALDSGTDMVGLVFHPKSPRFVSVERAADLAAMAEGRAVSVALLVDHGDEQIAVIRDAVRPRLVQLHGKETSERVREIRAMTELPAMKAVGVAGADDLAAVQLFAGAADLILLDAKPPKDAAYPGGHGRPFDWDILRALPKDQPFMLSGGLTPENVADAIRTIRGFGLSLKGVDVSSGVESAPGIKDADKIRAFIRNARNAVPSPRMRGEG
jgi:phosphoribosylanthranilate isomerase